MFLLDKTILNDKYKEILTILNQQLMYEWIINKVYIFFI
jgi:hypothetical protein